MRDLVTVDQVRTVSYLYDGERAVAELSIDDVDFHPASPRNPVSPLIRPTSWRPSYYPTAP